jgi:hypothetical protein
MCRYGLERAAFDWKMQRMPGGEHGGGTMSWWEAVQAE